MVKSLQVSLSKAV